MDKNTIIAIVLSFIVLVVSLTIQQVFVRASSGAPASSAPEDFPPAPSEPAHLALPVASGSGASSAREYTITTDLCEVTFTSRGGDIVSYKLLEHEEQDTHSPVEMADGVTDSARAFSLSLFGQGNATLDDVFDVTRPDANTLLFSKTYILQGAEGSSAEEFTLQKRYTFLPGDYAFTLDITITSSSGRVPDFGDVAYALGTSPQVGPSYDSRNRYDVRQILALNDGRRYRRNLSGSRTYELDSVDWAGVGSKYFVILIKPVAPESISGDVAAVFSTADRGEAEVFLSRTALTSASTTDSYYVYVGPRQESELIKYNDTDRNGWHLAGARFNEALQTGLLYPIEVVLKWCLERIHAVVGNWGVAIIILTIILKLILFPMNRKTAVGSLQMQKIQPKMQEIQEKYANDQQRMGLEMQKLYKEAGYNPMSGCLPMIIQMFILFALYSVFNNYFEFRGAAFIPGWIDDLSVGDSIWTWDRNIFLISGITMNHLRLLPFIYTISQLLSGKITQYGGAASGSRRGSMTFMLYGMPIIFFFLFYNVPSGLLLYWATSNIWQIGQQLVINRTVKRKREEEARRALTDKNTIKFKGGKKKTR